MRMPDERGAQWLAVTVDVAIRLSARERDRTAAADHDAFDDGLSAVQGGLRLLLGHAGARAIST